MSINKNNYEAFFLDYHEGNLTPQQVADLLLFVEQHPELKEEFESFENFTLEDFSSYTFENKEELKREITERNKEEYFVRSVDGSLSEAENLLLDIFLKQHPQYSTEFEFFQKTKLHPDASIVFENKHSLKKDVTPALSEVSTDHLVISAVEGLLGKEEKFLFEKQLSVDPEMRKEFALYQQTISEADSNVIFENKNELKRKENKVVPLFYYASSIAAALLILAGLFFIFNSGGSGDVKLANGFSPVKRDDSKIRIPATGSEGKILAPEIAGTNTSDKASKNQNIRINSTDSLESVQEIIVEEPKNFADNNIPENKVGSPEELIIPENIKPVTNTDHAIAKAVEPESKSSSREFMSLGEMAAAKIKSKTLDPETLAMEQKTGRVKKFSGWDILQVVAKGASKLTGKKVEAKPTYNEEGEVTAYALGAGGFQFSKGKKSN
jgi:hypothetical protein